MSGHLRGIVIAGALAALALGLGFMTLMMNQTASKATPHVIIPLKDRHHAARPAARKSAAPVKSLHHHAAATTVRKASPAVKHLQHGASTSTHKAAATVAVKAAPAVKVKKVAVKRQDANVVAALKAGLPREVAVALGKRAVVVVEVSSNADPVGKLSAAEAKAGAALAGAEFVGVNTDHDGGTAAALTLALGKLPDAPAALIYVRPAKLTLTLAGFADRTVVQQAAASAAPSDASVIADSGAWAAKVNAICTTTDAKVNALGGGSKLKPSQGFSIYGGMYKKIAALTPPAGSAAAVRSANALLQKTLGLLKQGQAREAAGHVSMPLYMHALDVLGQWSAQYNKLGASACTGTS